MDIVDIILKSQEVKKCTMKKVYRASATKLSCCARCIRSVSNIENGRVAVNLRLLMRAANLFKCKLDDIISGTFPNEEERAAEAAAGSYSSEEVRLLLKMLQVSKSK